MFKKGVVLQFFLVFCSWHLSYSAIFTVTNTSNSGTGTLREAITLANTTGSSDTINFQIAGPNLNINLTSTLPSINAPLTINGNSQVGSNYPLNLVTLFASTSGLTYGLMLNSNNINITGLRFYNFVSGSCILADQNASAASTFINVNIASNVFQDSKYSISATFSGFQNLNIQSNKFWHCSNSNINYTPRYLSRNVLISNNEFSGDSLSSFRNAITLCANAYPFGQILGITISGNYIRNSGIDIAGFTKIDTLKIISNTMGYGAGILFRSGGNNTDSCKNVLIENNSLDSLGGIGFLGVSSGDTSVYKNVTIRNNNISGNIRFFLSYTSSLFREYYTNVNIENNVCHRGIGFDITGTGNCIVQFDSLFIIGNTIDSSSISGVNFFISGTGSYTGILSNVLIRGNSIRNSADHGIAISHSSISNSGAKIEEIVIDSNTINANSGSGVYLASQSNNGPNRYLNDVLISDNEIFDNLENGISMVASSATTTNPFTGIHILRNSIYDNGLAGIFETANALYANPRLPGPILDWVNFQSGTLAGHVKTKPLTAYEIQFYANYVPGNNGIGEGRIYFATVWVATDTSGYAPFQVSIPSNLAGLFYSATATDVTLKSTSEFSNAIDSSTVQYVNAEKKDVIHCFPLPADDVLYLSMETPLQRSIVSLADLTGRVIFRKVVEAAWAGLAIDVSATPDGCYLLCCENEACFFSKKIIVQH